ncbi:MAG TPA: hypothetical protein VFW28_19205 [Micropepsaceae bacterium]|nr:hypothetical protein [Micropepsaceae bacterium]
MPETITIYYKAMASLQSLIPSLGAVVPTVISNSIGYYGRGFVVYEFRQQSDYSGDRKFG